MAINQIDLVRDSTMKQIAAILAQKNGYIPESYRDIQSIVRMGLARSVFNLGDIIEVGKRTTAQASLGNRTGITAVTIDADKFTNGIYEASDKEYKFIYDGKAWTHEGKLVLLNNLGLSTTGSPAKDDEIIVITTASQIEMMVVGFLDEENTSIKLKNKALSNGLILHSKNILYNLQFDNTEAIYSAEEGLAAGIYNIELVSYDDAYGGGATYQFTLTQPIPAGGQIVLPWAYNKQVTEAKISTFASGSESVAIESNITVIAGNAGTSLGTCKVAVDGSLNSIHRMRYGSNRWATSAMRQHLNSKKPAGAVWEPKSKFDRPPSWLNSTAGFMNGLDPAFIDVCADVEILTALSTAAGDTTAQEGSAGTGYEITQDKFFLPSRPELFSGSDNASDKGTPWEYYKINSDASSASYNSGNDSNRTKLNSAGNPYYWWMRSPSPANGGHVRLVTPAGNVSSDSAGSAIGVAPACIIA